MTQLCKNGQPAYQKIQGTILKRLESGQLKPGDMVDSERELAKIHRVSLMTARHALSELEREGMVVRRRGAGTFVASPKIHFNRLMSYTEQMSLRGLTASSKLLSLKVLDSEPEVAARLALPASGRIIKVERLRLGGNEPFAIETCYLSADEFADLTRTQLDRVSLFSILERNYGVEVSHADEEVDVTATDPCYCQSSRDCCWYTFASHSPGDLFEQGQDRFVRGRPLPMGPPHPFYPEILLAPARFRVGKEKSWVLESHVDAF